MLKHISNISALVVSLTLSLSILHEWVYFSVVGSDFMFLMQISDYVAAALKWVPLTLTTIVGIFIYEMYMKRVEKGLTEEEIIALSDNPERLRKFRNSPYHFWMALTIFVGTLYFLFVPGKPLGGPIPLATYALWLLSLEWVFSNERMREKIGELGRLALIGVGFVLMLTISDALSSADSDIQDTAGNYSIQLAQGESQKNVKLLRTLERGALVRNPKEKAIEFLPWPQVTKISHTQQNDVSESRVCSWFGVLCLKKASPPKKPSDTE